MAENLKKIEKPWAVFSDDYGARGMGKVVSQKGNTFGIKCGESHYYRPQYWNSQQVETFDSPLEAMDYLLVHQTKRSEYPIQKYQIREMFSVRFPSQKEKANPGEFGKDW